MRARRLVIPFVAALLATAAPLVSEVGLTAASAAPVTVTGAYHAWDPVHGTTYPDAPTVTVDQTTNLTDQVVHVTWDHFTPSSNPAGPFYSQGQTYYAVTVLQCKGTAPADPTVWVWPHYSPDCYPFTPDAASAEHGVGNEVYTLTGSGGSGEAYFHVETSVENDFLGCDSTHPCSLVVVPNWGGKQPINAPPTSPTVNCDDHSGDTSFVRGSYARDDFLGLACSWRDRLVVPLSFAPTPQNCSSKEYAFAAEGAPLLARTVEQWQAGWCQGASGLTFDYDSTTNEYLARTAFLSGAGTLTSAVDMAMVNSPADSGAAALRRFQYAPVTNSAIAMAYHIDDQRTGQLITNLVLNARLVAKLITQSYALDFGCLDGTNVQGPTCDPGVKGNPASIFDDPEFLALNPTYTRADFPPASFLNRGQFMPLVVSGNSDLVHDLTGWIQADADARGFVAGTADQWGMHVNTYYKDEGMPMDQFQVLDPGYTAPDSNGVPGVSTMQVSWNPLSGLDNVAGSLVIDRPSGINPTLPACGDGVPCVYGRFGSEPPGTRAMFAVVGLPDAAADRFPTASLVNASGHAVAPTDDALNASLHDMTANSDGVTMSANFASTDPAEYPLTMTEYGMVPSCGLTSTKVNAVKAFLDRVTASQTVGLEPGQLAPGAVPLTSAQRAQVATAARAVSSTACPSTASSGGDTSTSSGGFGGSTSDSSGGGGGGGAAAARAAAAEKAAAEAAEAKRLLAYGVKGNDTNNNLGAILPLLLIVGALLIIGGPATVWLLSTGSGQQFAARITARFRS